MRASIRPVLVGQGLRELYERYFLLQWTASMSAAGKRWVFIEPFSEAATIGLGGLILMLALAVPAFSRNCRDDWLKKSDLAVRSSTATEIRSEPRHQHNDSIRWKTFRTI